jgi:hypothetical protein
MKTLTITADHDRVFDAFLDEVVDCDFLGAPITRRDVPIPHSKYDFVCGYEASVAQHQTEVEDTAKDITHALDTIIEYATETTTQLAYIAQLTKQLKIASKNADRYEWLRNYLISDDTQHDDAIIFARTTNSFDSTIDTLIHRDLTPTT